MSSLPGSQNNLRGMLLLIVAALIFTAEIVLVRIIGERAGSGQIVAFRALGQLVVAAIWIAGAGGLKALRTDRPALHVGRGAVSLACWLLYYLSFRHLDIATATVLTFSTSLFVVAVAGPVLKEHVGGTRWAATLLGFGGVVLVTGIGTAGFQPAVLFGLFAAAGGAAIAVLNRILARTETTASIMFYIGLVTVPGTLPFALHDWQPLALPVLGLGTAMGLLGATGMWFTIEAYRVGEVSALAPIPYMRIIFSIAAGMLLFDEVPSWVTLSGATIIVASAMLVTRPERRRTGLAAPHR